MKFPNATELRRVWSLAAMPDGLRGPSLERIAHHEAGHVVLMEWAGVIPTEATATERQGIARFDAAQFEDETDSTGYDRPLAAAQAAAMFHAGIVAELIYTGTAWRGITVRERSDDWLKARQILAPHFGHGLAGHGYSQRVALAVLTRDWPRVQQIATRLIEAGTWTPNEDDAA
jgi:hypothetical protein